jgi:hypothetical protein
MTSERSQAYGRVVKMLADISASKFHAHEDEIVRNAADALFFCESLIEDAHALDALDRLRELLAELAASGRLLFETAERLVTDVEACGPEPVSVP